MKQKKKEVPINQYAIAEFKNKYNNFIYPAFKKKGHQYGYPLSLAIVSKINKTHTSEFNLEIQDLKKILHFDPKKSRISFKKMLQRADADMNAVISIDYGKQKGFINYHLVQNLEFDPVSKTVHVKVNPDIVQYFDIVHSEGGYTKTLVDEIATLDSFYSRQIYMLLRQWRTKGKTAPISIEELRLRLQIPKSYRINEIKTRVLKPSIDEIEGRHYFNNINIHDVKDPNKFHLPIKESKVGRKKILGFYFTFTQQNPTLSEMKKSHRKLQKEQVLVQDIPKDVKKAETNSARSRKTRDTKTKDDTAKFNNFI